MVIWFHQRLFFPLRRPSVRKSPHIQLIPSANDNCRGTWLSDPLNEHLMGRRSVIFFSAIFSLLPMIGCAVSQTWSQMLVCRLLLGVGMGSKAAVGKIIPMEFGSFG
jgi:hypothetical protein